MKPEVLTKPSRFRVEIGLLIDALEKLNYGDILTYKQLNEIAGVDVVDNYHVIRSSQETLLREKHMVFEMIRGQGIRRLTDEEISATGMTTLKSIGRKARKGIKTVSAADYEKLNDASRLKHSVSLSLLNMMQHSSSQKTIKSIEAKVQDKTVLPLDKTIELLKA